MRWYADNSELNGMRDSEIGELLNTRMADLNMTEQKITIYEAQKTHRGRVVYFFDDAKAALEKWLEKRDKRREILFYGARGGILSDLDLRQRRIFVHHAKGGKQRVVYISNDAKHALVDYPLNRLRTILIKSRPNPCSFLPKAHSINSLVAPKMRSLN
jgi:integrase